MPMTRLKLIPEMHPTSIKGNAGALSGPKDRGIFKGGGYIRKKGYEHKFYLKKVS